MFRMMLQVKIRAGSAEEFENVWRDVAAAARLAPGNLSQALLRDVRDDASYAICSDWATEEAFREFERSPEQDELTAPIRSLRVSAAMTVYRVVASVEPADLLPAGSRPATGRS